MIMKYYFIQNTDTTTQRSVRQTKRNGMKKKKQILASHMNAFLALIT